jgi:hypothetical protein
MERGGCSERRGAGPADPRADQENLASYANGVLAGALARNGSDEDDLHGKHQGRPSHGSTSTGCAFTASKRAPARWWCCTASRSSVGLARAYPSPRRRRLPGGRARSAGYNASEKPPRVRDYRPSVLVEEVADLDRLPI